MPISFSRRQAAKTRLLLLLAISLLAGCAAPETRVAALAEQLGFHRDLARSERFSHVVYRNFETVKSDSLSVYLEGDGSPWLMRYIRLPNPTPRNPLMLKMMGIDRQSSLYLGRPCYFGLEHAGACDPTLWTSGRYSNVVVNSMLSVLTEYVRRYQVKRISLYGHSGGATLALLLAERLKGVERVVTLAGNLDIDAWTDLHGYSPLLTSINPVRRPPLNPSIEQIHLMGAQDSNIPPNLARDWILKQRNSTGVVFRSFDHICCWQRQWPSILDTLRAGSPYRWRGELVDAL